MTAAVAIACSGCTPARQPLGAADTTVTRNQSFEILGPFVPARTVFEATLLTPLDAQTLAAEAQPFTASIREDLRSPEGVVIARRGATLRGYARVDVVDGVPSIVLTPSSVGLLEGEVWVGARVHIGERDQREHAPGTPLLVELTSPLVPPRSSLR